MNPLSDRMAVAAKILQLTENTIDLHLPELFWMDQRPQGGWRLSDYGEKRFQEAKISSTTVKMWDIDNRMKTYRTAVDAKTLLDLDKHIKSPYYIEFLNGNGALKKFHIQVKLYDERIGTMMLLYGSVYDYLQSVKGENND
jgi:hypothetical protein